jgi:hypothetical protein
LYRSSMLITYCEKVSLLIFELGGGASICLFVGKV